MNISTEHILQCNQSEPLADASERIVDLMNDVYSGRNRRTRWRYTCLLGSVNNYILDIEDSGP